MTCFIIGACTDYHIMSYLPARIWQNTTSAHCCGGESPEHKIMKLVARNHELNSGEESRYLFIAVGILFIAWVSYSSLSSSVPLSTPNSSSDSSSNEALYAAAFSDNPEAFVGAFFAVFAAFCLALRARRHSSFLSFCAFLPASVMTVFGRPPLRR